MHIILSIVIVISLLPVLLSIDIPPSTDLDPPIASRSSSTENTGQVIVIHQVAIPRPLLLVLFSSVLLLIFCEYQLLPPAIFPAAVDVGILAAGRPVGGFGNGKNIAPVVELEVLFQVQLEVPRGVGAAGYSRERSLAARGAKLLGGVLADLPAAVAAEDPGFQESDAGEFGVEEALGHQVSIGG